MSTTTPRTKSARLSAGAVSSGAVGGQGTLGGKRKFGVGRRSMMPGDEAYLWVLVIAEIALMGWGRRFFRRRHGG